MESYNAADIDDYDTAATETGSTGEYYITWPSWLSAGIYTIQWVSQAAASIAESDLPNRFAIDSYYWDGTNLRPALAVHTAAILADTNELQTDLEDGGRLDVLIDALVARLTAARAAKLDAITEARLAELDPENLPADVAALPQNKTGYKLAADGLDSITATESTGKPSNFREWVMWLVQRFRRSKMNRSTGKITVEKEDGTAVTEQEFSDDGTTQQLGGPTDA